MTSLTRRRFLLAGGVAVVVAACADDGGDGQSGSGSDAAGDGSESAAPTGFTAADFEALGACVLMPGAAAGPFPLTEQFIRRDVTEGYPGHSLRLGLRVIDAECVPVSGAAVEIWHADATGDYSAFEDGGTGKDEAAGTTFLRGTQIATDEGIVEFHTIYPGWYPGRTVHIHLRVRVFDDLVLTGQIYFDDDYSAEVFLDEAYVANGLPDTSNERDALAGDVDTDGTLIALTPTDDGGTIGLINLAVNV